MKIKALSIYSKILSFLLILLGFSSCGNNGDDGDDGDMMLMYGTPTAKFIVKGKIVNEKDKDLSGLKVALGRVNTWSESGKATYYVDSVNTDTQGLFKVSIQDFPTNQKFVIRYEDVDGEQNGLIETVIDTVRFEKPKFTNGSGAWYAGETTKDLGTIKLESFKEEK